MKRIVIALLLIISAANMLAGSFRYMVIEMKDGAKNSVALCDVKLQFDKTVISIINNDQTWQVDADKVARFYFSADEESAVDNLFTDEAEGTVVYDVEGRVVGHFASRKEMEQSLTRGIYIIKSRDEIFKRAIK